MLVSLPWLTFSFFSEEMSPKLNSLIKVNGARRLISLVFFETSSFSICVTANSNEVRLVLVVTSSFFRGVPETCKLIKLAPGPSKPVSSSIFELIKLMLFTLVFLLTSSCLIPVLDKVRSSISGLFSKPMIRSRLPSPCALIRLSLGELVILMVWILGL